MAEQDTLETKEQEQKAVAEKPEAKAESAKDDGAPEAKPHDFDKGLSKVQRKFNEYQRKTDDTLNAILAKLEAKPAQTPAESKAADAIEDFLTGRDPGDVPSIGDFQKLVQVISKAQKGLNMTDVTKAVRAELEPLLAANKKATEDLYWAKFLGQHPSLDQSAVNELWSEATDMAEEDGGSAVEIEAATKAHFKHLVKSKERSLKRSESKPASTKSPTSPDGADVIQENAHTTAPPKGKASLSDLYKGLAQSKGSQW